eukprot:jgi/Mesvir1/558/Mv11409-RA.1
MSTFAPRLSAGEIAYMRDGISQNLRNDGRSREEFRQFVIDTGVVPQANGSSRIQLGGTDIIAGVKAEIGNPSANAPGQGALFVAVELSPTASPEYEGKGGEELSKELSAALERSLLPPKGAALGAPCLDLGALSLLDGKYCWHLHLDLLILAVDGNLVDAAAIAAKAALADTLFPKVEALQAEAGADDGGAELEVSDNPEDSWRLDTKDVPLTVTVTLVGSHTLVDASAGEEALGGPSLSVAVQRSGQLSAVTKRGHDAIDASLLAEMLAVARRVGCDLLTAVDAHVSQCLAGK